MIDLSTRYLGLNLKSPLVASSSPLCKDVHNLLRMEDCGAGAVVLGDPHADPAILAVDFDSKGGAVVSGRAAPGAVAVRSMSPVERNSRSTPNGAAWPATTISASRTPAPDVKCRRS